MQFGDYYHFRHRYDWAAEFLERAERGGASISHLTLARSYWLTDRNADATREFKLAIAAKEAPEDYLQLCCQAAAAGHP